MFVKSVSKMSVKYPKIKSDSKNRFYIDYCQNGKRYRLFNGSKIKSYISPNSYPVEDRYEIAKLLAAEVFKYISIGLSIEDNVKVYNRSDLEYLTLALDLKLSGNYSDKYKSMLQFVYDGFVSHLCNGNITSNDVKSYLSQYGVRSVL